MSRKDFCNLSQRQKRRIVLRESNVLNVSGQNIKKKCIEEINSAITINDCNSENDNASINNNCNDISSTFNESESDATDNFHSLSSDDTLNIENSLHDDLRCWVITKHNISQSAVNDILRILLRNNLSVPVDCRTLMKTPRNTFSEIIKMNDGKCIHFAEGLKHSIKIHFQTLLYPTELKLNINIDGLPITKSTSSQFWPILGAIVANFYTEPFVIGIYHGNSKPQDVFLKPFVDEAKFILDSGLNINGGIIRIKFNAIICDVPAKSFVCGIKSHTGYFSCIKCIQEGEFIHNKVVFLKQNSTLRTDLSFKSRQHEEYHVDKYLIKPTILETLNIGMVSDVPLDCMHLIFLGVNKTMLRFWIKGPINIRLIAVLLHKAQKLNSKLKMFIPIEFARRLRDLLDLDRWKATEHKLFALYTGIIIMKNVLSKKLYIHFTCLCVAVRIVSDKQYKHLLDYAQSLFEFFVQKFREYYGDQYLSHNVHNLIHICNDVKRFGTIDSYSAFKFENYLYTIKKS